MVNRTPDELEYIEIDCGFVKYMIAKGHKTYYLLYSNQKVQHFASVPRIHVAYKLIQSHLKGRHQAAFSIAELMSKSGLIASKCFKGVPIVKRN